MLYGTLAKALKIVPHPGLHQMRGTGGANTFAMAALNQGWAARWRALDTRDVKGCWVNWSSVSVPGTVQLRIETIDATTCKPTGTLYDANAVKSFTPTAGWQQVLFDTLPTTGLTVDSLYAAMLLTTVAGTTQTLRSHTTTATGVVPSNNPGTVFSAASANTRSNLSETVAFPIITWVMEDNAEEIFTGIPFATTSDFLVYGTRAAAAKLVLAGPFIASGITAASIIIGTTASLTGDIRFFVMNSTGSIISGTDVTVTRKLWQTDFGSKSFEIQFAAPVTFAAGTYYIVCRNTDGSSVSSAAFMVPQANCRAAAVNPSGLTVSTTTDITASPPTWSDTNTDFSALGLMGSDLFAPVTGPSARTRFIGGGIF